MIKNFSGVGNYIKSEVLYVQIHPEKNGIYYR